MYRIKDIITALKGVVGWDNEGYYITDEAQQSESGLTFQMSHPLVTLRNIMAIMNEQDATATDTYITKYPNGAQPKYAAYAEQTAYNKGDKVSYQGLYYEAKKPVPAGETPTEEKYWKE